ncbi:MAG: CHAT domain-containing protein [Pseudomonadota bacterium]
MTRPRRRRLNRCLFLLLCVLSAPLQAGVLVTHVSPGLAGEQAGARVGDILLTWQSGQQQRPLMWPIDAVRAAEVDARLEGGTLTLLRDGQMLDVALNAGVWGITNAPDADSSDALASLYRQLPELTAENLEPFLNAVASRSNVDQRLALLWLAGDHFEQIDDLQHAGRCWQAALDLATDPAERALLRARYAQALMNTWESAEARLLFKQALEFWEAVPAPQHQMRLQTRLGFAAFEQRDLPAADAAFSTATQLVRDHPAAQPLAASALRGMGQVRSIQGGFDDAIALGYEALDLAKAYAPRSRIEAKVLNFLGYTVARTHNVADGETLIREAIALADEVEPSGFTSAGFRNNLALVYYLRRDYAYAQTLYEQALERFERRNPVSPVVARTRYNIALTLARQDLQAESATMLESVLALQRQLVPGTEDEARTLHSLAFRFAAAGELTKAITTGREAVQRYRELLPDSYLLTSSIHKLGDIYIKAGDYPAARDALEESLERARRISPESQVHAESAFDLGRVLNELGEPALPLFREAVEVVESLQARLGGGDDAVSRFREYYSRYFRRLIEAELEAGNTEPAFAISERYRAQSFLAVLGSRPAALTSRLPEALKENWGTAQAAYEAALKAAAGATEDNAGLLNRQVVAARQAWRDAGDSLRSAGGVGHVIAPRSATPALVAESLAAGQVLISFVSQPDHTDAFLIDDDGRLTHHRLALSRQQLSDTVNQIRVLMAVPDAGAASVEALEHKLEMLGEALFAPLLPVLDDVARLVVIPDGELWLAPMAALITEDRYLLERFEVQLGWSATAFQTDRPTAGNEMLLAMADPGVGQVSGEGKDATRDAVRQGQPSLPGARQEVTRIASFFSEREVYLDQQASERNFRQGAVKADVVHVAAHAVTRVDPPMESYLQLEGDEQHDGRLMAWEVLENLDLKAQLVTLSGCATALGKGAGGEGLMGLTRAFGLAGAQRVLASLWPVSDQATAGLMTTFYENRAAGMDDVQALRQAQLSLLQPSFTQRLLSGFDDSRRHPFYWAAFSLYGSR